MRTVALFRTMPSGRLGYHATRPNGRTGKTDTDKQTANGS